MISGDAMIKCAIKKPTCVGFFIAQDQLSALLVPLLVQQPERMLLERRRLEQRLHRLEQKLLERVQVLERVLQLELEQVLELQQAFRHKRRETMPTRRQRELSISWFFLIKSIKSDCEKFIGSLARHACRCKDAAFYQLSSKKLGLNAARVKPSRLCCSLIFRSGVMICGKFLSVKFILH